jgi:glycosyltransferase involved in cell wall biosynthesis
MPDFSSLPSEQQPASVVAPRAQISRRTANHGTAQSPSRRICMVVHSSYPDDARVRREAMAAVQAGHAVDVICMRNPGEPRSENLQGVSVRRLSIRHVTGPSARRMIFEYLLFAALATLVLTPAAIRRRYQVVHVHNPPDFLIVAGLLPRLFGCRLILDVHDLSSHMFKSRIGGKAGKAAARLLDLIELWASRIAHVVLTVHEPYRLELISHGVSPEKLVVVMNVTDPALLSSVAQRRSERDTESFTVVYAGTIAPWYGVELIVDAVAALAPELPQARALILGVGDALEAIRARAASEHVADRIEFSGGWVPAEEALIRMARASCGVIPNRPTELNRFALSTKLFEYIAIGLPVVAARLQTLEAHFSEDEVTFFEPGDVGSLAAALRWIATHPSEAEIKTRRAQARVSRQYSWTTNAARFLAAIVGE